MLNGYIIEKYNHMGKCYTSPRIMQEAKKSGICLELIGAYDTVVTDGALCNNGTKLDRRDIVINRHKWGKLKDDINLLADRSYNALEPFNQFVNKYLQIKCLRSGSFLIPDYIFGTSSTPYEMLRAGLGDTIVAKGLESSMGREIFLIQKPADMEILKPYGESREWLFETFIDSSYGRDLRIYSVRGEAVAAMVRESDSDFRANVALGAHTTAYAVDETIRKAAADIYRQTGLDFVGIDLLFGKDGFCFCEINVMPGLEGIEQTTGVNIAAIIARTIKADFA